MKSLRSTRNGMKPRAVAVGPDGAPWIIGEKNEVFASVDSLRGINARIDARNTALTEPPRAVFFVLPPSRRPRPVDERHA